MHALIAAGLVDEYRLFVFPVVVGRGTRLFEPAEVPLRLLETRPFVSGAVLPRYAHAHVSPDPGPPRAVRRAARAA